MRVFYDFEFLEHQVRPRWFFGRSVWTVEPLSLGIKVEGGREYYAVFADAPWRVVRKNEWLMDNVVPSLPQSFGDHRDAARKRGWLFNMDDPCVKPGWQVASEVATLLQAVPDIELWAWYGAFDHVSLAWLWGRMSNLPDGIPMYTNDLRQRCRELGEPTLPEQTRGVHNALDDARHNEVRAHQMDRIERHPEVFGA